VHIPLVEEKRSLNFVAQSLAMVGAASLS